LNAPLVGVEVMYINFASCLYNLFNIESKHDKENQSTAIQVWFTIEASLTGVPMKIEDLEKHATCYRIAKMLGVTPTSVYQWKKTGKVPPLRVFQLKEMKPEWFKGE